MKKFEKKNGLHFLEKKVTQPIRMEDSGHMTRTMLPPFGEEGCLANQNGEFQSHDEKKNKKMMPCFVMQHNADKHYLYQCLPYEL